MKVSSEQQAPREAVLTVELDNNDVEPYLERAYRQVVQRLNIPGFRRGKAPRKIVEQLYGRDYLLHEALDFMVQDITSKAVEQESLELGGIPSISIEQLDPPSFKATVPLVPLVKLGDYLSVRVPMDPVEITEEQVDTVIEQLRRDMAVWEPVDGPVEMDDLINLTVVGWLEEDGDRREIVRSENTDYIPRPGTRFPVPGLDEGLVGLAQGKTSEFTVDVPEDFENQEYAGKKVFFEATIHSIKRRRLPELDDEFAKGVGEGFESLEALREQIRQNLREQQERNVKAKHQDEVLNKVVEGAEIEISPLIIDHELEHYLEEREQDFRSGRMTFEEYRDYLASLGKSPEEQREEARSKVEQRLKRAHVLREVVQQQGIEATDEEIDAEIEEMASGSPGYEDEVRKLFADQERRAYVRRLILNRKALEFLSNVALGQNGQEAKAPVEGETERLDEADASTERQEAGGD